MFFDGQNLASFVLEATNSVTTFGSCFRVANRYVGYIDEVMSGKDEEYLLGSFNKDEDIVVVVELPPPRGYFSAGLHVLCTVILSFFKTKYPSRLLGCSPLLVKSVLSGMKKTKEDACIFADKYLQLVHNESRLTISESFFRHIKNHNIAEAFIILMAYLHSVGDKTFSAFNLYLNGRHKKYSFQSII